MRVPGHIPISKMFFSLLKNIMGHKQQISVMPLILDFAFRDSHASMVRH